MEPPLDVGMNICSFVQIFRVTRPRWLPDAYMVKTLKNLLLRNQEIDDHETWYTASSSEVLPYCSNDDTGLTLTIFVTWPNLFPNASAWVKLYTAYSHVFPSLFSTYYMYMHSGERYRIKDPLVGVQFGKNAFKFTKSRAKNVQNRTLNQYGIHSSDMKQGRAREWGISSHLSLLT